MKTLSTSVSTCQRCPLCAGTTAIVLETITYARIWSALADDYGARFDCEVRMRHSPSEATELVECETCGLIYFNPAVPGDADFYEQLTTTASAYYSEEKWDFNAALDWVVPGSELLDIACGGGAWLRKAQRSGALASGIDTNPAAVAMARSFGLQAYSEPLEEFSRTHRGRFDVVTAFQVVEHIPEVLPFIKAAALCLKPGGRFLVTVPNRLRSVRAPFEPLDHPPHHMSRWSESQFTYLARATGLELRTIKFESAPMSQCRTALRSRIAPVGFTESLWARILARIMFSPSLYAFYLRNGLLDRWKLRGMSMMAVFENGH
jgi:SAM-dependent methyltransferase